MPNSHNRVHKNEDNALLVKKGWANYVNAKKLWELPEFCVFFQHTPAVHTIEVTVCLKPFREHRRYQTTATFPVTKETDCIFSFVLEPQIFCVHLSADEGYRIQIDGRAKDLPVFSLEFTPAKPRTYWTERRARRKAMTSPEIKSLADLALPISADVVTYRRHSEPAVTLQDTLDKILERLDFIENRRKSAVTEGCK